MRLVAISLTALLLCSCASYSGRGLKPGEASLDDVIHTMGAPAMRWQNADGAMQLAYPRGPLGFDTYMVFVGREGKLQRIENVLKPRYFSLVRVGMTKDQVLRILGPSVPAWTGYYKARDELALEWRYCSDWRAATRFDVLFDGSKGTVRSTFSRTESCGPGDCPC
ncbi:hypothetical protein FGKAn22_20510 [Ferrigenium kumadai]|uniref:Outer membrane protein assembly factor BamE n=1 Tax=Ferrigenium kumadai TaxID=1682490 RepID=A0AAN1T0H8_9PROT|nr:hypothetical protein [Ferrigenium kumadai]BBJ00359.1 hypothetical protein FGKAn22_20510 [Ferrigenium kumadai]